MGFLGSVGDFLGGVVSTAGDLWSGHQNRKSQRSTNETEIELANTAHQREIADLQAAGLNPILSADGGGASVPQLGTPSFDNPFKRFANSVHSALNYNLNSKIADSQLEGQALSNKYQGMVNDAAEVQLEAEKAKAELDSKWAELEYDALADYMGYHAEWKKDKEGRDVNVQTFNGAEHYKAMKLMQEGIEASLKQKSNLNWRSNLSSFMPFASPIMQNSAQRLINPRFR